MIKFNNIPPVKKKKNWVVLVCLLIFIPSCGFFIADKIFTCQGMEGQIQAAKIQMDALVANLKILNKTCSRYPTEAEGLQALIEKPQTLDCPNYPKEGFLEDGIIPLDPWDKNYVYKLEEGEPVLYSSGEDQEMGTDDDISSKPKRRER